MKKLLIGFLLLVFGFSLCEGQSWVWGREANLGRNSYSEGSFLTVDKSDNVFLTGLFKDTMNFGTIKLLAPKGAAFLVKYDSIGNTIWAKQSTAKQTNSLVNNAAGLSIVTDINKNVYMTGLYRDTITFDTCTLNYFGMFLVKYNSGGNAIWAISNNSPTYQYGVASGNFVTKDKGKSVYVAGTFEDTITFNVTTLISPAISGDGFLAKYDTNGNLHWAVQSVSASKTSSVYMSAVTTDGLGNVYVTGYFWDTVNFGSQRLISSWKHNQFIVKYDSGGSVVWAKQSTQLSYNSIGEGWSITTDKQNKIYLTGDYKDTLLIGSDTLISATPESSFFVIKYDTNGNVLFAFSSINLDMNNWYGYAVTADTINNIYVAVGGYNPHFNNSNIVFGNDTIRTSNENSDGTSILLKLDNNGRLLCGSSFAGGADDNNEVTVDPSGKYIYFGGDLINQNPVIFGNDTLSVETEAPFVARWQPCPNNTEGIRELANTTPYLSLFPNPNTGAFTLEVKSEESALGATNSVEIYNVMGQKVFSSNYSLSTNHYSLGQPNGVYLYRVIDATGKLLGEGKFVIEK